MSDLTDLKFFLGSLIRPLIREAVNETLEGKSLAPQTTSPAEKIYTKPEAADFLHITEQTLSGYVSANKIPFCKPTDGKVYFLHSDLIDWLKKHRTATVTEATEAYQQQRSTRRQRSHAASKAA